MKFILFLSFIISIFSLQQPKKNNSPKPCTCLYYETLKEQLQGLDVIAYAKVIKIDTITAIPSDLPFDSVGLKMIYDSGYFRIQEVVFKSNQILKGKLSPDTFRVLSENACPYSFNEKQEYIVGTINQEYNKLEMISNSMKCDKKRFLSTNFCCANTVYYKGAENRYLNALK